ncbi:F-box/kelch-repeat protein at3g23880 [Phtheirospermum japonicum]|uniref:F-box/kelch-repeat protein at3g23880 n=1 Tax=Phtheirospermum japonicum TaxID=374723 RepID=A0A830BF91_9LAMI|nr:F-box/kelch-repeat protein at3g23880 [Phtheirospermum japonicum]
MEAAMATLPWDIIVEILSRVAVKSLMRFKCVSKSFNDLISRDSLFKKKHLDQSNSTRVMFHCNKGSPMVSVSFSDERVDISDMTQVKIPHQLDRIHVYTWDNGLFCFGANYKGLFIWNPSTQESECILQCKARVSNCIIACGLIYDPDNDEYKVFVRFERLRSRSGFLFFSSRIGVWRQMFVDIPFDNLRRRQSSFNLLNGASHWIADNPPIAILSITIADEKCERLPFPSNFVWKEMRRLLLNLTVLSGKLCLSCCTTYYDYEAETLSDMLRVRSLDLWVMEEYGAVESWSKKISIPVLPPHYPDSWIPWYVFVDGTKMLLSTKDMSRRRVFIYDVLEESLEQTTPDDAKRAYVWKETLASPHPNREVIGYGGLDPALDLDFD